MWEQFKVQGFRGIASNNVTPQINEAEDIQNFDLRGKFGALITRKGRSALFSSNNAIASADHRSKLGTLTYLAATSFIAESSTGVKQEITIMVTKGTVSGDGTAGSINNLQIWASHQWNGTAWVRKNWDSSTAGWYWLNHTIYTDIDSIDATYTYKISTSAIYSDTLATALIGWTVYNVDKNEYSSIIKCYDDATSLQLAIAKKTNSWGAGDKLVLMRNYIPYSYLLNMGGSVSASDISFYKPDNNLRISFAGKENVISLFVGYQKKYLGLNSLAFTTSPSISDADITAFNTKNNLFCEAILYPAADFGKAFTTEIYFDTAATSTELPLGKYNFRIVGLLGGFNQLLISESEAQVTEGGKRIRYKLSFNPGMFLNRFTSIELYAAYNDGLYYFVNSFKITDKNALNAYQCNEFGQFLTSVDTSEDYVFANCLCTQSGTEVSSIGDITTDRGAISSVTPGHNSIAKFKHVCSIGAPNTFSIVIPVDYLYQSKLYDISFEIASDSPSMALTINFGTDGQINVPVDTGGGDSNKWTTLSFKRVQPKFLTSQITITCTVNNYSTVNTFLDNLSIIQFAYNEYNNDNKRTSELNGIEISSKMGYEPTKYLALSWDKAVESQGKTHALNPYFEQDGRISNYLFFSPISGSGAIQWDVIPFTYINAFNWESFDGNDLLTIEVLPNGNILELRRNSAGIRDAVYGSLIQSFYGKGIASVKSVINDGQSVKWVSQGDIFATDGLQTVNISETTINDKLNAVSDKSVIFATREIKGNAYRLYFGTTGGTAYEYILTNMGWIGYTWSGKTLVSYYTATDGTVIILDSTGVLYKDLNSVTESESIPFLYKTINIDGAYITGLNAKSMVYLKEAHIRYNAARNISVTISVYRDGTVYTTRAVTLTSGDKVKTIPMPLGCSAKRIAISISGTDSSGNTLQIFELGFSYKIIPGKGNG